MEKQKTREETDNSQEIILEGVLGLEKQGFESIETHLESRVMPEESNLSQTGINEAEGLGIDATERRNGKVTKSMEPIGGGLVIGFSSGAGLGLATSHLLGLGSVGELVAAPVAGLAGAATGAKLVYDKSRKERRQTLESIQNQQDYLVVDEPKILGEVIQSSEIVMADRLETVNIDADGEYIEPETAAEEYIDALNVLKEAEEFWEDEEQENYTLEQVENLISEYRAERVQKLGLIEPEETELAEAAANNQSIKGKRDETSIRGFIRSNEVEHSELDMSVYQIEVYRGSSEEIRVTGLTDEITLEEGQISEIDYELERELKKELVGIDYSLNHKIADKL